MLRKLGNRWAIDKRSPGYNIAHGSVKRFLVTPVLALQIDHLNGVHKGN
jgi:hypothetical protein